MGKNVELMNGVSESRTRGVGILEAIDGTTKVALPLSKVDIAARVADRVAQVTVTQAFRNERTEAIEAVYTFPLAGGSAVSAFEMKVGKRVIKGVVKERSEARAQYDQALKEGKRAALLEQERDDVFTVQVGNLPPGEEVTVTTTYSEKLPFFEDGMTELRLPLVVGLRYIAGAPLDREAVGSGTVADTDVVPDASRITPPRLAPGFDPKTALNLSVTLAEEVADLACSQHATKTALSKGAVTIALAKKDELLNRDFVLRWRLATTRVRSTLLVSNGRAMLSILPPKRDGFLGLARDVVFVLDRSGSMGGAKMASAARACSVLLQTLGPRDRFAIQAFDDSQEWMPGGFTAADEGGLEKGEKFLRTIDARGGTEMYGAVGEAIGLIGKRKDATGRLAVAVLITDGEVGDESRILKRIQTELGDARVFTVGVDTAVNDGFLKRLAALGGGTASFVVPGDALEEALRAVGREIGAPLVTDLVIDGADEIAPARLPDLFAGRAATAFFGLKGASVTVKGKLADGGIFRETVKAVEVDLPAIAHLWARTRVADLEDEFRLTGGKAEIRKRIVQLAVAHTLLTRFTAFVVVDESEVVNKDGSITRVVQPVHMPDRWEMQEKGKIGRLQSAAGAPACCKPAPAPAGLKRKCMEAEDAFIADKKEAATPSECRAIEAALKALLKAWADAKAAAEAGGRTKPDALDNARKGLLAALAKSVLGQQAGLLQKFLRSALPEVLAAMAAPGASLKALFEKHGDALDEAWREAEQALGHAPAAKSFWESSV
jgi:Ca-activated chloride channel family protein